MKKTLMVLVATLLVGAAQAQNTTPTPRTITIIGVAEEEVTPDIIYLAISLKEYFKDNNNKNKVNIDALEKQLYNAAMKAGVKAEDFTIQNVASYKYEVASKKKDPGFLASKQYRIRVSRLDGLNDILEAVDAKGIQYSRIDGYDVSNKKELEKTLKIRAAKEAKEKASYLAEALGETLGKALSISENGYSDYPTVPRAYMAMAKTVSNDMAVEESLSIDVQKIKMTHQIHVTFLLQ
jgi:uncharacterized protein YggE